jgi:hypothetical protein
VRLSKLPPNLAKHLENLEVKPVSRFRQGWREIGGKRCYFRSQWEANYARYLEYLKVKGDLKDWFHEPRVFYFEGIKRGTNNYKPDFQVIEKNNTETWHEVKGYMDPKSKTKIKRMAKYYPDIKLIVIEKKDYKMIAGYRGLIPGWE